MEKVQKSLMTRTMLRHALESSFASFDKLRMGTNGSQIVPVSQLSATSDRGTETETERERMAFEQTSQQSQQQHQLQYVFEWRDTGLIIHLENVHFVIRGDVLFCLKAEGSNWQCYQ